MIQTICLTSLELYKVLPGCVKMVVAEVSLTLSVQSDTLRFRIVFQRPSSATGADRRNDVAVVELRSESRDTARRNMSPSQSRAQTHVVHDDSRRQHE
jgi:hypothetical protein